MATLDADERVLGGRRLGPSRQYGYGAHGRPFVKAGGKWRTLDAHLLAVRDGTVPVLAAGWERFYRVTATRGAGS